jgi:hypothetical protein
VSSARHGVERLLTLMVNKGSITPAMRDAALDLRAALIDGAGRLLPATLGPPAASCLAAVLANDQPLRQWAKEGWCGRPVSQETASGVLIGALGALAHGNARLLLNATLESIARRRAKARPLAMRRRGLQTPGEDRRSHPDPTALAGPDAGGPARQSAQPVRHA